MRKLKLSTVWDKDDIHIARWDKHSGMWQMNGRRADLVADELMTDLYEFVEELEWTDEDDKLVDPIPDEEKPIWLN